MKFVLATLVLSVICAFSSAASTFGKFLLSNLGNIETRSKFRSKQSGCNTKRSMASFQTPEPALLLPGPYRNREILQFERK